MKVEASPVKQDGEVVGVELNAIESGSLLAQAGLKNGDVLRSVDGEEVATLASLLHAYSTHRPGESLTIEIQRDDESVILVYKIDGATP